MADINATITIIEQYFSDYPVLFAFLTALIGNSIPYATIPYLVFFVSYGAVVKDPLMLVAMSLSGGIGAALGKLVVYYIGRGVNRALSANTRRNLTLFAQSFSKSLFIVVFLFAALPLPDDVIYLPLGVAGYSVLKFFVAVALGKIVITFMALVLGVGISSMVESQYTMILALVAGIALSVIIARINWERVVEEYRTRGWMGFIQAILVELVAMFTPWRKGGKA